MKQSILCVLATFMLITVIGCKNITQPDSPETDNSALLAEKQAVYNKFLGKWIDTTYNDRSFEFTDSQIIEDESGVTQVSSINNTILTPSEYKEKMGKDGEQITFETLPLSITGVFVISDYYINEKVYGYYKYTFKGSDLCHIQYLGRDDYVTTGGNDLDYAKQTNNGGSGGGGSIDFTISGQYTVTGAADDTKLTFTANDNIWSVLKGGQTKFGAYTLTGNIMEIRYNSPGNNEITETFTISGTENAIEFTSEAHSNSLILNVWGITGTQCIITK